MERLLAVGLTGSREHALLYLDLDQQKAKLGYQSGTWDVFASSAAPVLEFGTSKLNDANHQISPAHA